MFLKFVAKTGKTCESQRVKLTLLSLSLSVSLCLSLSLFLSLKNKHLNHFSLNTKKISKMSHLSIKP